MVPAKTQIIWSVFMGAPKIAKDQKVSKDGKHSDQTTIA